MTATTTYRLTKRAGLYPARVTLPMAAATLIRGGTIVCRNASDQAVPGVDGEGFHAVGIAKADFDNTAGLAAAKDCEAEAGIFGLAYTGTIPTMGDVVYVVDNQTVSLDGASGTRGIAGIVTEVVGTSIFVWMGPTIPGQVLGGIRGVVNVPLNSFRVAADGTAVAAFADGSADGFELTDSEALGIRFNPSSTAALATCVPLPDDLDEAADVNVHVLGFRVGSADATAALTFGAFFQTVGAAHTADADAGGDTTAFDGATTIVTHETLALAAANVPAAPCALTLTMVPTAALDADDLVVLAVWLEYTKKL